jgi:hypothetical protein
VIARAIAGEIEAEDLVRQTGGPWTKAKDVRFLQAWFLANRPKETPRQGALERLTGLDGVWIPKPALIVVGCVLLVVVGFAVAWADRGIKLGGTNWQGSESLTGFNFHQNGTVTMLDARSRVQGTWSQKGLEVTITFQNCEYRGFINGPILSGTAHYHDHGIGWSFSLKRS